MHSKLMFLFLLVSLQSAWSQVNPLPSSNSYSYIDFYYGRISKDDSSNKIEGSQYIDQTFYSSTFTCISEATPPIRYNTYKEEMEFMVDGKLYYLNKNEKCELTLNNITYKYFINYDSKEGGGYLVILNKSKNAKYILYKKEKVKFVPAFVPSSSYAEEKPPKYAIDKSRYFIKIQDNLVEFPAKKSELLKLFPNSIESIELFLKENKIKFSEEASLLVLINFLNTL